MTSPRRPLLLVTGNSAKLAEARRIVGPDLEAVLLDLPEVQSLDLGEVLRAKAAAAWERLRRPLVVEETGLELAALRGFPGPLVKWMLAAVGAEGIARTALALGDPAARAVCLLEWTDGERSVVARGETAGRLVLPARGGGGFGWDPVFQPDAAAKCYAEMSDQEKDRMGHRGRAWRALLSELAQPGERGRAAR